MPAKVSVLVTCYNHEQYIEQCLRSIFKQTYRDIDLLVLDDGSTDRSFAIIEETMKDSPFANSRWQTGENRGLCGVRNHGLTMVSGDYLAFIDSDDFLDENYIQVMVEEAEQHQADIVYCDLVNAETQETYLEAQPFDLRQLLAANYIQSSSLMRMTKVEGLTYDMDLNRKKLEDYEFFINLILNRQAKPYYTKRTKLNYRVLQTSMSRDGQYSSVKGYYDVYFYILEKYLDSHPDLVLQASRDNLYTLEGRLDDLIQHHDKVSQEFLHQTSEFLEVSRAHKKALNKIKKQKSDYKKQEQQYHELKADYQALVASKSYRLGSLLIKLVKYPFAIVRRPALLLDLLKSAKRRGQKFFQRLPHPLSFIYKPIRHYQRRINNYQDPGRLLVYVIYENGPRLQSYKLRFLEALLPSVSEVMIVVNGHLHPEDEETLGRIGQILQRDNVGYDTAAFREAVLALKRERLMQFDELVMVNDTNVGPLRDLSEVFDEMTARHLDFWGISYGEEQEDITGHNKYRFIPRHLQSYFLVVTKSLFQHSEFYRYWESLDDTDSRDKAIGKHETVFTKHFTDLGFKADALLRDTSDSAMYIHPLTMVKEGSPLVKYSAFANYDEQQFLWQGLERKSQIPALRDYIAEQTDYPVALVDEIIENFKNKATDQYILIIDGVENIIPQCTRYRVTNKAEQLASFGLKVKVVNYSDFQVKDAQFASHIIIYRAPYSDKLLTLCELANQTDKPVFFDIDDLVFDTVYTDQLAYTQGLSQTDKENYDANVRNYGRVLALCDGAITSTNRLKEELRKYNTPVLLNRNLASQALVTSSQAYIKDYNPESDKVKVGYFSGSISHNENFQMIERALVNLMDRYPQVELHIVGYLDVPSSMAHLKDRIKNHDYVDWTALPGLISQVDINLAPLVPSIFNEAKSEIKWLEASLVKVPTLASRLGAFADSIQDGATGLLADPDQWEEQLESLVLDGKLRQRLAEQAYEQVLATALVQKNKDEMVAYFIDEED